MNLINTKRLFLKIFSSIIPTDFFSDRHPISVKGICFIDNKVILLKNERNEWDLPGGKLNKDEDLKDCLSREIKEELNIKVSVESLIDVSQKKIMDMVSVLILIYSCSTENTVEDIKISFEHYELGLFSIEELNNINIPLEYKSAIVKAHKKFVWA